MSVPQSSTDWIMWKYAGESSGIEKRKDSTPISSSSTYLSYINGPLGPGTLTLIHTTHLQKYSPLNCPILLAADKFFDSYNLLLAHLKLLHLV